MSATTDTAQLKKNYLWNTLGSLANAFSSVCMLLACTRLIGVEAAGLFSLAFALAQQFQVLGHFEIRSYQATDANERFSFAVYYGARIVTCTIMVLTIMAYTLITKGLTTEACVVILVALLRIFDAFEDVFHGMFQQKGRLDIAGKAFFFRICAMMLGFTLAAWLSRDLQVSCVVALIVGAVTCFVCNIIPARRFVALVPSFRVRPIARLLLACLPLFCGSFMLVYITNAPKYAIDAYLTPQVQALYSYLFMPSLVINLLSGFVFKPLLTEMSTSFSNHNIRAFISIIVKGFAAVCVATVVTMIAAGLIGIQVLSTLSGIDLAAYALELQVLLVGGLFNALGIILYYAIVTMRHQRVIYGAYGISCIACYGASALVERFGLMGAAVLYDIAMGLCAACFLLACIYYLVDASKLTPAHEHGDTMSAANVPGTITSGDNAASKDYPA